MEYIWICKISGFDNMQIKSYSVEICQKTPNPQNQIHVFYLSLSVSDVSNAKAGSRKKNHHFFNKHFYLLCISKEEDLEKEKW